MVARGMSRIVHYEDISKETLTDAIQFALRTDIQENAKKVSYSYRYRPQTPAQTAVWWVEHVAKTGGAPLTKSYSTFMPFYTYYSFDIYVALLAIFTLTIVIWIWMIRRCFRKKSTIPKLKKTKY